MARFLLIHGSCHGAWCWVDVIPALRALGHDVVAIDLPGNGDDRTPAADVSLALYADRIANAARDMGGDVHLVGHSLGGVPISAAAERAPDLFRRLIYVTAYVPRDGQSVRDLRDLIDDHPLSPAILHSDDGLSVTFRPQMITPLFYHDCPPQRVAYAKERLCPQPIAPQRERISLSTARYGSVQRAYVLCDDDRAIPPRLQRMFVDGWDARDVHHLPCAHSPFFAMPDALATCLAGMI